MALADLPETLGSAAREFVRHASPLILMALAAGSLLARLVLGGFGVADLAIVAGIVAFWPLQEWLIHVFILHYRPVEILGRRIDFAVPRLHRAHHRDPFELPLVFVPLHLWTFKFGAWYETTSGPPMRDLHRLVIEVFTDPLHAAWYVVAMTVIGFHLWHGFGSAFETVGIGYRPAIRWTGRVLAVVVMGGFAVIPIVVLLGGAS